MTPIDTLPGTGETRVAGPEPFKLRVCVRKDSIRVSLTDFFMSRVEAAVLQVPLDPASVRLYTLEHVWGLREAVG